MCQFVAFQRVVYTNARYMYTEWFYVFMFGSIMRPIRELLYALEYAKFILFNLSKWINIPTRFLVSLLIFNGS